MPDTVGLEQHETTSLWGIAKRATACKDHRFQDLYRCLDANLLLSCWDDLNKKAASGVDEVTAQAYELDLIANILDLSERLKTKRYRAKLVWRCYLPKEGGGERPLGIPALEDKLVQLGCAKILKAFTSRISWMSAMDTEQGGAPKRRSAIWGSIFKKSWDF